jgi:hypothetical protein
MHTKPRNREKRNKTLTGLTGLTVPRLAGLQDSKYNLLSAMMIDE